MITYKHTHAPGSGYAYHAAHRPTLGALLNAGARQAQFLARSLCDRISMAITAALLSARRKR